MRNAFLLSSSLAALALVAGLFACGSDSTSDATTPDAATTTTSEDSGTTPKPDGAVESGSPTSDAATDAPTDAGPLLAPLIDLIKSGDAGVTLGWTNNTPDCDAVIGERKTALETYKQVFSVSGTTTTTTDTTSPQVSNPTGSNCTYRVACQRGGQQSPYSNEESVYCLTP